MAWMEDSRPGHSTLGVKYCIDSDVQVEHTKILHLDPQIFEKRTNEKWLFNLLCLVFMIVLRSPD